MSQEHTERLRAIKTFPQLVVYLRDELGWEVSSDDFEELTFEYSAEELGLDSKSAAKVKEIRRLRPLVTNQPWGIFFVNFEPRRLPVVALRRVLRALVTKKRASANPSERPAWAMGDLLFISSYGEADHRDISFAHFVESQEKGDLPTLKVLGWDDEDTGLRLRDVHTRLREFLLWPEDAKDTKKWREQWAKAFLLEHREVIRTSKDLAVQMARLAQRIRKRALKVLEVESDKGPLRKMMEAFREALIHDLDDDGFADMYAQTITYGLLTARVSREAGLVAENVVDMVPVTNPFLRDMLQMFLTVGGRKAKIDFDELGINEVVHALREANMEQVLKDFGDRNPQEDPVIHFYELFLKEYDAKKRMQRGVFYTPRPVVSYIVRSVHELLQTEFGLEDGLADTTTWGEMAKRHKDLKIPEGVDPKSPFVNILDPATGTATFLVEVIDLIHKTMKAKWLKQGHMQMEIGKLWNEYVPKHLLPRVHGYELLMAPYAVAHMKIGLKLWETGYRFKSDERARTYLTNALEPGTDKVLEGRLEDWAPALAHEATAVNAIKRNQRFTVVLGNPPYSGVSSNNSETAIRLVDAYKVVDGAKLAEKKLWLQDDYVKFLRFAQLAIEQTGCGLLGFITNHGYLDNPTFRGMRQSLLQSFHWRQVIDLHGNAKKKEVAPNGNPDVNVFEIQQGVAIGLFVKRLQKTPFDMRVFRGDLYGGRDLKYRELSSASLGSLQTIAIHPSSPFYLFVSQDQANRKEYESMHLLSDITYVHSVGVVTARDHLTIAFTAQDIWERVKHFVELDEEDAREEFTLRKDVRDWKVALAQADLRSAPLSKTYIQPILYRPFDVRFTYFTGKIKGFIGQPASAIMGHMLGRQNLGLMTTRKIEVGTFGHALCSRTMTESHSVSLKEVNYLFPLWIYPEGGSKVFSAERSPNFTTSFLQALSKRLGFGQLAPKGLPSGVEAEDVFNYVYSVLHSPTYRSRYAQYLRVDFPRIPLPNSMSLFCTLGKLGGQLERLHSLVSPELVNHRTLFVGKRTTEIEKVTYAAETVWIDKKQTTGFKGVPEDVWNFHIGGYQVCHKWLKDRKGRTLSQDDINHYHKIVVALSETIRLMAEIDKVINQHGGWPAAFQPRQP